MTSLIRQFRMIGYLEGISFLLLLGIAMPLKYMFDMPMAVSVIGMLHGVLFVLYVAFVVLLMFKLRWSLSKGFLAVIASVLPFGPFVFDAKLLREKQA
ncbi:DUF3817 domain-containing protein [Halalkalibacter urbisdiaboli]|uniref:DUF3817 domain-containing protein n=1 Tax=Halalkalibacter urbisdiaboli TaxID=1960589 RepID=UPI000B4349B7|nr:DUF3817 domain-containing protein [Halalkalibacter urbisdiaboli]